MMQLKSRVLVDAMREDDIPEVQAIEREIFPTPWPRNAYYRELHHNRSAYYLVLRRAVEDERRGPHHYRRRPGEPAGEGIRSRADGRPDSACLSSRVALADARGAAVERRRGASLREVRFQSDRSPPWLLHGQQRGRDRHVVRLHPGPELQEALQRHPANARLRGAG